jgi:peptidoglycan lytic transglycosylase D
LAGRKIQGGADTKKRILLPALAATLLLAGCEQTARKAVQVQPPAPMPRQQDRAVQLPIAAQAPASGWLLTTPIPAADMLVAEVQALYDEGQRHYQAGELDQARQSFDSALNLLLKSHPESYQDPRLKTLFNKLADTMHQYDLEAASQPETTEEENSPAAPIEEIAGMALPPGDPRLAQRAEEELITVPHDLPLTVNDAVLSYLGYFQTHRGKLIVETGLRRLGLYEPMIRRILRQEGLPQDLVYLAQAESAFQPEARSRAGARGIWQFMPLRGEEYDLKRTRWVDERSDPEESTRAAAEHLRDLYHLFGDWYLVMAAYNSGPVTVAKAIEHTGYADFWDLEKRDALPAQTRNYVPIILALTMIAKDPARWGIHVQPEAPIHSDVVHPGHELDLRLAAEAIDSSVDELRQLNPALLGLRTPDDSDFALHLPAGTAGHFQAAMAKIPADKWLSWRYHRVEEGETLAAIARKYRVTEKALISANDLSSEDPPAAGVKLIVPAAPEPYLRVVHYRVRPGDTVGSIASAFGVTSLELRRWNHLRSNRVRHGARLRIVYGEYETGRETAARTRRSRREASRSEELSKGATRERAAKMSASDSPRRIEHRVQRGETLFSIARAYRTTVEALRRANPFLNHRELEAGDRLLITAH